MYELSAAYPELETYFGLLTGAAYTVPYAAGGLIFGRLAGVINPKTLVVALMLLSSGFMGATAVS